MLELPDKYPWLYQNFLQGYHTVRRSKRFWSGFWSDLIIEQVMMKSQLGSQYALLFCNKSWDEIQ